jgi:hypothetical protein
MSESGTENTSGRFGDEWDKFGKDFFQWEQDIKRRREAERLERLRKLKKQKVAEEPTIVGRYKHPKESKSVTWSFETPSSSELEFGMNLSAIASELVILLESKQKDYGPRSVNGAPGGPINGLLVRLHDKFSRAGNLAATGKTPNNESLRETFIDIAGYALLAIMVIDEKFPKE